MKNAYIHTQMQALLYPEYIYSGHKTKLHIYVYVYFQGINKNYFTYIYFQGTNQNYFIYEEKKNVYHSQVVVGGVINQLMETDLEVTQNWK